MRQEYFEGAFGQNVTVKVTNYYAGGAYEQDQTGIVQTDGSILISGTITRKYYAFAGQTVAMVECSPQGCGAGLKYFLTDTLGSVVAVVNSSGGLVSRQGYYPYGGVRSDVGTITTTDFGYTEQRNLDAQGDSYRLGLMDYKARFYDSYLHHFIQPDTLTSGGPQGLNRYAYTMGNPVNGTDPTGHKACDDEYGCDPLPPPDHAPTIPTIPPDPPIDDKPKNDNAVKGLKIAATVTQDIATLIDGVWAGAEVGVLIAASTGWPETIPEVILGMDVLYNVYGGNAAENAFSGLSLLFTGLADLRSGNRLGGENFLTSASTFGAGTLMQDPIGDFAIDAYASSYTHGILNGVQTIINGGPIWKGIWKWY